MSTPIRTEELRAFTAPRREDDGSFTLTLDAEEEYLQTVDFGLDGVPSLVMDEPEPLGARAGPNPVRVLGAALGGCLGASLLFCLRKSRLDVTGLHTTVRGTLVRNDKGRLRVGRIAVRLEPVLPAEQHARVPRCVELFEDFCVVTASVRPAIDVRVEVVPVASQE
jgi:organic hydroperoxide reductase OsmC/OhrA